MDDHEYLVKVESGVQFIAAGGIGGINARSAIQTMLEGGAIQDHDGGAWTVHPPHRIVTITAQKKGAHDQSRGRLNVSYEPSPWG